MGSILMKILSVKNVNKDAQNVLSLNAHHVGMGSFSSMDPVWLAPQIVLIAPRINVCNVIMGSSWISLNAQPVPLFVKHATLHHNAQPALEVTSLTKTSNVNFVEMLVQNAVLITIVPNVKVHFT